eukprot:4012785-Amphidinium_carterae.1
MTDHSCACPVWLCTFQMISQHLQGKVSSIDGVCRMHQGISNVMSLARDLSQTLGAAAAVKDSFSVIAAIQHRGYMECRAIALREMASHISSLRLSGHLTNLAVQLSRPTLIKKTQPG